MSAKLAKHGTQAGYKAELTTGRICDRCQKAHTVYNRQWSAGYKKRGIKYNVHEVLDHLYTDLSLNQPGRKRVGQGITPPGPTGSSAEPQEKATDGPSIADRIGSLLGQMRTPESNPDSTYVSEDEIPDYIDELDPDPEPMGGEYWEPQQEEEFIVNAAGLKKIQDNLGFYFVTVGMTLEMIDPYCGAIAAQNANNVIEHWSKVIAVYPAAAKFFMGTQSGKLFAWINALQATWPILLAIYRHHFERSIKVKDGIIYSVRKDQEYPDP